MSHTTRSRVGLHKRPAKNRARQPDSRGTRHDATPSSEILELQKTSGNQAVSRLIREAAQGTPEIGASRAVENPGSGQLIDSNIRSRMESRFGEDFSDVRVHTDSAADKSAQELRANAYTKGKNVVFASGKYQPETAEGQERLAHELTHVLQQRRRGIGRESDNDRLSSPHDASEREAEVVARGVMRGQHAPSITAAAVGIQRDDKKDTKIPLLDDFAKKFPDAAKLISKDAGAMKLVKDANTAGVKFGGFAEDGPGKRAWPYTIGNTVYVAKGRADVPVTVSDFLFELNNAVRAPKFKVLDTEAAKGTKGKLTAKEYARKTVELEVEGMLRMGEIWFEMKKSGPKGGAWDKYDSEFFLAEYKSVKEGKKTKEDIVKSVLGRVRNHEPHPEWTIEQKYMEDYESLSGGK